MIGDSRKSGPNIRVPSIISPCAAIPAKSFGNSRKSGRSAVITSNVSMNICSDCSYSPHAKTYGSIKRRNICRVYTMINACVLTWHAGFVSLSHDHAHVRAAGLPKLHHLLNGLVGFVTIVPDLLYSQAIGQTRAIDHKQRQTGESIKRIIGLLGNLRWESRCDRTH